MTYALLDFMPHVNATCTAMSLLDYRVIERG